MNSIKKNLFYQGIYEILIIILPLFTSPYIARVLGAECLGIFSYTYSIAYYFQIFGMLGLKFYGNRKIAQVRDDPQNLNQVFSELFFIHIIIAFLSFIVYLFYCIFLSEDYQIYTFIQSFMVISTIFDVSWLFFGLEKFKLTVTRNTIIKILSVICIFLFVHDQNDLWIYILIMAGSQFISQFIMYVMSHKYVDFHIPSMSSCKKHMKPLLVLFVPVIALSLFKYMDKVMLGFLGSKEELGFYENSEKILNIPLSIVLAFGSVMLPKMSNLLANNNDKECVRYIESSIKYMGCLSIAMAFGMAGIASIFAPIFWGDEFLKCSILIQMLAISLPFSTIANIVRNQDLIPNSKDNYYSYAIVIGAIVNLAVNWILIPKYQSYGVVIGTIVAEIVVCLIQLILVRRNYSYFKYISSLWFFLIPGFIMYGVVVWLGLLFGIHIYTLFIQILCGGFIYCFISGFYYYFMKDLNFINLITKLKKKFTL